VLEGGHAFTEAEIARGSPRWWWGSGRRAAYERVLLERGMIPRYGRRRDERAQEDGGSSDGAGDSWADDRGRERAAGAALGAIFAMKATEAFTVDDKGRGGGGSDWGSDSDSGTSSSSSGDSGGSGSSGE
jgi:hypothetical protein